MTHIDPRAELAPRNVVAGEIHRQLIDPSNKGVFLTLRHLDGSFIKERFPTIDRTLASAGYSLSGDLLPVAPAMHYFMGGVVADIYGRTGTQGVLAIGEVSCTGVHGANRLASNSLLEGLVFGINAADQLTLDGLPEREHAIPGSTRAIASRPERVAAIRGQLQAIMSRDVGVMRDAEGLSRAIQELSRLEIPDPTTVDAIELRNMIQAGRLIAGSALAREESRGGHIRADFPETDPRLDGMHQVIAPGDGDNRRRFGALPLEART